MKLTHFLIAIVVLFTSLWFITTSDAVQNEQQRNQQEREAYAQWCADNGGYLHHERYCQTTVDN